MPRYQTPAIDKADTSKISELLASLDCNGRWIVPLNSALKPYIGPGDKNDPAPEAYEQTTGDPHNTASLVTEPVCGISTRTYIDNMATFIASLTKSQNR